MSKNSSAQSFEQKNATTGDAPKTMTVLMPAKNEEQKPTLTAPTIEEIKRRNDVLTRLVVRHENLTEKRRMVENFQISHDRDTASVLVSDANGEHFQSNSPKTISKLIEFWKAEFNEAIAELEREILETV